MTKLPLLSVVAKAPSLHVSTGHIKSWPGNCLMPATDLRRNKKMFRNHVTRHLSAYHHGELSSGERLLVEAHLRECPSCRAMHDEIRLGARLASALSLSVAPESTWNDVAKLRQAPRRRRRILPAVFASFAFAAAIVAIFAWKSMSPVPSWEVIGLPGMPHLRAGEVLQTDSS